MVGVQGVGEAGSRHLCVYNLMPLVINPVTSR